MHGLVRCTHWVQVFTCTRGGCDNHRCQNKNPRYEIGPGTWMMSCPEAMGWWFWNLKKKTIELRFGLGRSKLIFGACRGETSSLRRGAARGGVRWKSQRRKKLCVSLFMSKNLKLKKVLKRELCFVFFGFLWICVWTFVYPYEYVYYTYLYQGYVLYRWFNKGIPQVQSEELASLSEGD